MGAIQFRARLQPFGPAAAVLLDDDQVAAVGEGAKRFPVRAAVNGYTWRTSVALATDPQARASYERMAFTHRKEYARWVAEAKREETRQRRAGQALEMIRAGKTRS